VIVVNEAQGWMIDITALNGMGAAAKYRWHFVTRSWIVTAVREYEAGCLPPHESLFSPYRLCLGPNLQSPSRFSGAC
jgi:hypothetical protein